MKTQSDRKVLICSGVRGDTYRYRALHLYEQLVLCGIPAGLVHMVDPAFNKVIIQDWDLVIFERIPFQAYFHRAFTQLKEKNTLLLCDFDDLVFDPSAFPFIKSPDFVDPIRTKLYLENMQSIREMLDRTRGSLASTDFLAGQIQKLDKPAWVHRNAFNLEMLTAVDHARNAAGLRDPAKVVIGYASGTPTHNYDLEMIRPALKQVMARYPQVELRLVGPLDPGEDWGNLAGRVRRLDLVPWRELPGLLAGFDINLAPLVMDNPFAQSKSEIKYMEAGMLGVPTVASPTDAFSYAIQSGENGFLASTEGDWVSMLSELVEDRALRTRVGQAAQEVVMQKYSPAARARELASTLEEIMQGLSGQAFWNYAAPDAAQVDSRVERLLSGGPWVAHPYEKAPTNFQLGLFSLRAAGLAATMKQVWIFFRRLISPLFPFKKS